MKIPPNFARVWVKGTIRDNNSSVEGWKIRLFNKGAFIPRGCICRPHGVRSRLEAVLGIEAQKTAEDLIRHKSRIVAANRRTGRNKAAAAKAAGKPLVVPWLKPRTLQAIKNEEIGLAIALRWQRMGEYKK